MDSPRGSVFRRAGAADGNTASVAAARRARFGLADVRYSLLSCKLSGSLWLGRQLKNRGLLTFTQACEQHDLAVRKFECIVMRRRFFLVDLPKDCGLVIDRALTPTQKTGRCPTYLVRK